MELIGKEKEVFYYYDEKEDHEFTNDRFDEIFEFEGDTGDGGDESSYDIYRIKFLDVGENEIDDFIKYFLGFLKDKVGYIFKFEDTRSLEIRKQYFEDIYTIEMNLREVLSFIFFSTYHNFHNILSDTKVSDITQKLSLKRDDLEKQFENELFYISFKDYKNILDLRDLKEQEKTELLKESRDFDHWKQKIFQRGIKEDPYINFINSISQNLSILENFRNAIMHSHSFSNNLNQNYEKAKGDLLEKIQDFREKHMKNGGNYLGLIIGKTYKYIGDSSDYYIHGNEYELIDLFGSDAVFLGENNHIPGVPFFDKEMEIYWDIYNR